MQGYIRPFRVEKTLGIRAPATDIRERIKLCAPYSQSSDVQREGDHLRFGGAPDHKNDLGDGYEDREEEILLPDGNGLQKNGVDDPRPVPVRRLRAMFELRRLPGDL